MAITDETADEILIELMASRGFLNLREVWRTGTSFHGIGTGTGIDRREKAS